MRKINQQEVEKEEEDVKIIKIILFFLVGFSRFIGWAQMRKSYGKIKKSRSE